MKNLRKLIREELKVLLEGFIKSDTLLKKKMNLKFTFSVPVQISILKHTWDDGTDHEIKIEYLDSTKLEDTVDNQIRKQVIPILDSKVKEPLKLRKSGGANFIRFTNTIQSFRKK